MVKELRWLSKKREAEREGAGPSGGVSQCLGRKQNGWPSEPGGTPSTD